MTEVKVCSFPANILLDPLTQQLEEQGIDYRVVVHGDRQDLYAADEVLPQVSKILDQLTRQPKSPSTAMDFGQWWQRFLHIPVTYTIIILSILGYLLYVSGLGSADLLSSLTYTKVTIFQTYVKSETFFETFFVKYQWWRLITPMFLHFNLLHITFNSLAALEFGRRLEVSLSRSWYIVAIVMMAICSNSAQFYFSESALFGGLSGVVFGLFGLIAVLSWRLPIAHLRLPKAVYVMMSLPLILGPLGIIEKVFGVGIANHAHFGGLAIGALLGMLIPCKVRSQ